MRAACLGSLIVCLAAASLPAREALPGTARAAIDQAAANVLARTAAPSASLAVVKDGRIAYLKAYGTADLATNTAATPAMRYSIGSISKQFTAAAILLLAEEGRLTLDDPVAHWFPDLTRAKDITVRQLLSMTSGYQDYWPQDYVMPGMLKPVTPREILDGWARKPLDFEPGTKWQYSNTNYVVAGQIVEKVTGQPLLAFLKARVFGPLGMASVVSTDDAALGPGEPMRYLRYALGPARPAPKEGRGWMFAAGELAMTAEDLARWDLAMIQQKILKPASWRLLETEVPLANGVGTRYGLGVAVGMADGRRVISHSGEVSGFTATNTVYPDDGAAVVVLTNLDATGASGELASKASKALFATADPGTPDALAQARRIFEGLQKGELDRGLFTANANAYFTPEALQDFARSLGPLGVPTSFTQQSQGLRGGMVRRQYAVAFSGRTLRVWTFAMPDGKLEQYLVAATD